MRMTAGRLGLIGGTAFPVVLPRSWAGSNEGGRRPAAMNALIETAKLNDDDPRAYLADVLARLRGHAARHIDELLPGNCQKPQPLSAAA